MGSTCQRIVLTTLVGAGLLAPAAVAAQRSTEAVLSWMGGHESAPIGAGRVGGFSAAFGLAEGPLVFGPEFLFQNGDSLRLRAFALSLKLRQQAGRIHPHLVVGVGAYAWQNRITIAAPELLAETTRVWREISYVSASLGGGVTLGRLERGPAAVLEGRWHRNLAQDPAAGSRSLVALSAGLRVAW